MSTPFVESAHPRARSGQFVDKHNDAPTGSLTDVPAPDDEDLCACGAPLDDGEGSDGRCGNCADRLSCMSCGEEKERESDVLCADCKRDESLCGDCGSLIGEGDCGGCLEAKREAEIERRRAEQIRWGETGIRVGSRTPWGAADHVTDIAAGITAVGTPGHGGVKLTPQRNRQIPSALRESSGWYEEDCEWNIPARYFPEEFAAQPHIRQTPGEIRDSAEASIKAWFPERWEKANGRELEVGESAEKDRRTWAARQGGKPIVVSARNSAHTPGMVLVVARPGGQGSPGENAEYLVPIDEYEARRQNTEPGNDGRFVVDETRHPKLPPQPATPPRTEPALHRMKVPDVFALRGDDTLTDTARDRILRDLNKRWRLRDDTVHSLGEMLETGVRGISAYADGPRMQYRVELATGGGALVTKATWEYLRRSIPDSRTDAAAASSEYSVALRKLDDFTGGGDFELWRDEKAKARARKMNAEVSRLQLAMHAAYDAERAERAAREGSPEEVAAAAAALQAGREAAARISAGDPR